MADKFWVFDWLADNHITSLEQAAVLLPKYKVIEDLQKRAASASEDDIDLARKELHVVAGTGIDLSGGIQSVPLPNACALK